MKFSSNKFYLLEKFVIYCFLAISLNNCSKDTPHSITSNKQLYLGAYWVDDLLVPYPKLLLFEGDTATLYDQEGKEEDQSILTDSTLSFNNYNYFLYHRKTDGLTIYDRADKDKLRRFRDNILFRRSDHKEKKYNGSLKEIINNKVWNYQTSHKTPNRDLEIRHQLHFKEDSMYHYKYYSYQNNQLYSEVEKYQFKLFEIEKQWFLSFIDSRNTIENPLPIYELMSFNSSEIKWINHCSLEPKMERLSLANESQLEPQQDPKKAIPFYLCYEAEQSLYYYGGGHYRDGAQGFLRDYKLLSKNEPATNTEQNGYAIFHFKVSCEKKLGRYGLIQMDMDFQETQFDLKLIQTLFTTVNNSSMQWELPLKNTKYCYVGEIKDIKSFVMFKIQNGEVTEVLP